MNGFINDMEQGTDYLVTASAEVAIAIVDQEKKVEKLQAELKKLKSE